MNRDEKDRGTVVRDAPGTPGDRAFEEARHAPFERRRRKGAQVHPIVFQAVLRIASLPSGAALHAFWGEVTPLAIDKLWDAVLAVVEREHCDLEVTLTGEGKNCVAKEVEGRLARLSHHGITVQVR